MVARAPAGRVIRGFCAGCGFRFYAVSLTSCAEIGADHDSYCRQQEEERLRLEEAAFVAELQRQAEVNATQRAGYGQAIQGDRPHEDDLMNLAFEAYRRNRRSFPWDD